MAANKKNYLPGFLKWYFCVQGQKFVIFFSNDNYFPIFSIRSRILPEKLKKANNDRTFISHL